jgi:hypothetical protein
MTEGLHSYSPVLMLIGIQSRNIFNQNAEQTMRAIQISSFGNPIDVLRLIDLPEPPQPDAGTFHGEWRLFAVERLER